MSDEDQNKEHRVHRSLGMFRGHVRGESIYIQKLWLVCAEEGLTPQNSNQNMRFKYFLFSRFFLREGGLL